MSAPIMNEPLTILLGTLIILSLVLFVVAFLQLQVGRRGGSYLRRREASQRGVRIFVFALVLLIVVLGVGLITGTASSVVTAWLQTATPTLTPTPTLAITETPTPDIDATVFALLTGTAENLPTMTPLPPTPTQTPSPVTPSPTPMPSATSAFQFALPTSSIPPLPGAKLNISGIYDTIEFGESEPTDESPQFQAGIRRVYVTMEYRDMFDGVTWSRALYYNDLLIQAGSYAWRSGETGTDSFFFGRETGYLAGNYEVRLYLGNIEVARSRFSISESQ